MWRARSPHSSNFDMKVAVSWDGAPPDFEEPLESMSAREYPDGQVWHMHLRYSPCELGCTLSPACPASWSSNLAEAAIAEGIAEAICSLPLSTTI